MLTREQKAALISNGAAMLSQAKSVVIVNYRSLTAAEIRKLQKEFHAIGGGFQVIKKRLLERAARDAGITIDAKSLDGQIAWGWSTQSEVAAPKAINVLEKDRVPAVVGGILGKTVLAPAQVKALADLPPLEQLRAQLVGILTGPIRGLITVLSGTPQRFVQVLSAIKDQKTA